MFLLRSISKDKTDNIDIQLQELRSIQSSKLICTVKVLILHQHFNTPEKGGALRSYFLAKALVEKGHHPIIITAHNQKQFVASSIEGIEVYYLPIVYDNSFSFYKRVRSFLAFVVQSAKLGASIEDLNKCYAMSTPLTVGLAAIFIKWKKGVPFIFEVGDLWPDAPIELGFVKNPFLKFFLYRLEKFIYQQSESVVALSTQMKVILEKKSPKKEIHLLPNMADMEFFRPTLKENSLEEKFKIKNRFVISYLGSIGYANGLVFLLDCARIAQKNKMPASFILCGEGAFLRQLKNTAKKLDLNNVSFLPFTNRKGVQDVMNISDAILVCYRQHAILETGSPNKYFDGLAAGKLIAVNVGGWMQMDIEKHQCGVAVNSSSPEELMKKIEPYIKDPLLLKLAQQNSRKLAANYSREKLGGEFVTLVTR